MEGLWPVFSASAAFTPALLLPVQRSDPNPKRNLSLCEEGWEVCFLSAFRTKKQRFDPNSYPVLLQRARCCCHHLDGQSDGRSGLKVPSYECCSSLPLLLLQIQPLLEKKKKKKSVITEHMQLLNILFNITSACSENYISQFLYTVSVCQILPTRLP